jgi:hypothetical protein
VLTAGEFTVARKLENEQPAAGASLSTSSFSAAGRSRPCRPRADRILSARVMSVVDGRVLQVMTRGWTSTVDDSDPVPRKRLLQTG